MNPRRLVVTFALPSGLAVGAAACGGGDDDQGGTAAGAGPAVALKSSRFSPSNLTVPAGQTVTWDWKDRFVKHNVAGADFVSKTQRYSYRCTLHDKLTGTITVTAAK